MEIVQLIGTCDGSGDLVVTADNSSNGFIEKIIMDYIDGATGSDLVFSMEEGGFSQTVLTITDAGVADLVWVPRSLGNKSTDGTAFTNYGTKFFAAGAKMKVTIAQGGVSKDFSFRVILSDE